MYLRARFCALYGRSVRAGARAFPVFQSKRKGDALKSVALGVLSCSFPDWATDLSSCSVYAGYVSALGVARVCTVVGVVGFVL